MIQNYLRIGLRNTLSQKWVSLTNMIGLAIGISCSLLTFLFVENQLSYDSTFGKTEHIYRLETQSWVSLPAYLRETTIQFPEVENSVRFYFGDQPSIKYQNRSFSMSDFAWVDSTVFRLLDLEFLSGDPENALLNPNSMVLTKRNAERLFGSEQAVGKTLVLDNNFSYTVTGVVNDIEQFHMEIEAFGLIQDLVKRPDNSNFLKSENSNFSIYLSTTPNVDPVSLAARIYERATKVNDFDEDPLLLRPFGEIYFAQNLQHEQHTKHGNLGLVIMFSVVGVIILLVACVNFVNLTIARVRRREREVAVRKVMGAFPKAIRFQFFIESGIVILIGFALGLLVVNGMMSKFNELIGESIEFRLNFETTMIIIGILLFTLISAAIYPSLVLSNLSPADILKGKFSSKGKGSNVSKVLVGFQYSISIFLIIATITVIRQLDFMQSKELGIDHDLVLTFSMKGDNFNGSGERVLRNKVAFEERIKTFSGVRGITFLNQFPGNITSTNGMYLNTEEDSKPMKMMNADPSAITILGLNILEGRNLSYDLKTDFGNKILINEEAVRQFGLSNPIGSILKSWNGDNEVVGVMQDFHYNSLHSRIAPLAISWNSWTRSACVKLEGKNLAESIKNLESVYREFCPDYEFEFGFLDQSFAEQYNAEVRLVTLLKTLAGLAIFLSCMGLFTLTAFIVENRAKEISIRKVLGSSRFRIAFLMSRQFSGAILLANIIAWPAAYYLMTNWLTGFEYRVNIGFSIFLISGLMALLIAGGSIGIQALRATRRNPILSLRQD